MTKQMRKCAQISAIFFGTYKVASNDFTAIISLSDIMAIRVYESAICLGFSIPETYSIVGYDNILATKYFNPPLTTVQQPKEQTGPYAARSSFAFLRKYYRWRYIALTIKLYHGA